VVSFWKSPCRRWLAVAFVMVGTILLRTLPAGAGETFITLASTTSTENSGLFEAILPVFEESSGVEVRVVAVGTGAALRMARQGDADVLLVHDRASEERLVAEGWGVERRDLMYNDFLVVGPAADPAAIRGQSDVAKALQQVAAKGAPFASRGDDSGTHKAELRLWKAAGVDVGSASGTWYRETGSGMGAMLNTAAGMQAYALTDRATWLSFRNRGGLEVLVEGDPRLFNPYGVILVNPERHPHVKAAEGQALIDWLTSSAGQGAIGAFRLEGGQVFHPSAGKR
jgi:tungstate transport system substrate-binding protein